MAGIETDFVWTETAMANDPTRPQQPARNLAREARQAAELRANLGRRKALSRARALETNATIDDGQSGAAGSPIELEDKAE